MYLSMLNEKQKKMFLEYVYNLASVDGDYSEKEKALVESYCWEMHIIDLRDHMQMSLDEIIDTMEAECGERERRIIVFEAIGLAMVDGNYDGAERDMIRKMMKKFDIDNAFGAECERQIKEYIKLQNRVNELVLS